MKLRHSFQLVLWFVNLIKRIPCLMASHEMVVSYNTIYKKTRLNFSGRSYSWGHMLPPIHCIDKQARKHSKNMLKKNMLSAKKKMGPKQFGLSPPLKNNEPKLMFKTDIQNQAPVMNEKFIAQFAV